VIRYWLLGALLLLSVAVRADDPEVEYLLGWIRQSECVFVRNGDDHTASEAADHLAMKYRRVIRWIDDADEFIARIASGSSISGKPYMVRCPELPAQTSQAWLTQALTEYRQLHASSD
jgi:hypothetical protein